MPPPLSPIEAERAVIGAVLLDPLSLDEVLSIVQPPDFSTPALGHMLTAARDIATAGGLPDPVSMAKHAAAAAFGGFEAVVGVMAGVVTSVNVAHHARIVRRAARIRRGADALGALAERARRGGFETEVAFAEEAQTAAFGIAQSDAGSVVMMREGLEDALQRLQRAYETKAAVTGAPSGLADLDALLGGFLPGELVIIAARPSMGKTALGLKIAATIAATGAAVDFHSLEMPSGQLIDRLVSMTARVDSENMRTGHLADGDIDRVLQAMSVMKDLPLVIDDAAGQTVADVRAMARRTQADKRMPPLGAVVIDYIQLMRTAAARRGGSREQEVAEISKGLKETAKNLGVPVIVLAQLNRALEQRPNKRPLLSDLRESGSIEQDADVVIAIYRDEVYNEQSDERGVAEVIVRKNRKGRTGTVRAAWVGNYTLFADLARG